MSAARGTAISAGGLNRRGTFPAGRSARRAWTAFGVLALLAVLVVELVTSVRGSSQTWDEANHIYAGYRAWTTGDFGLNPEPPPLVKLLATVPLLGSRWETPNLSGGHFKLEAYLAGRDFLYANDADRILFETRLMAALITVALALLVFAAGREMFGTGPAWLALGLLVFEPNLLAHGALVTTDVGLSCLLFATVYGFYRHLKQPTVARLAATGVAGGLALATKHSALIVLPMLVLLAAVDLCARPPAAGGRLSRALRIAAWLAIAGALMVAVLWSVYGFRQRARPDGLAMNPPIAELIEEIESPARARALAAAVSWRLLPEAYLYGLTEVQSISDRSSSYLLGKVYARGQWFYFPVVFVIKSTLAFLVLLVLAGVAAARGRLRGRRELVFLMLPPGLYFAAVMTSGLNIGVRHLLPIVPFLAILIGAGAFALAQLDRRWGFAVAALLAFHAASSARAHPVYLAYSNELWGGPARTYRYLSDSNVDWGQQLPSAARYLRERGVTECWFAYFADVLVDPGYYGIPCQPLPTISSLVLQPEREVPERIDGPVLISASVLSGYEFGPAEMNPYQTFQGLRPTAVIDHGVFVFDGGFRIPLAAGLNEAAQAARLLRSGQPEPALARAREAARLAPDSVLAQVTLARVFAQRGWSAEAAQALRKALTLARTIHPDHQKYWIPVVEELEHDLE